MTYITLKPKIFIYDTMDYTAKGGTNHEQKI